LLVQLASTAITPSSAFATTGTTATSSAITGGGASVGSVIGMVVEWISSRVATGMGDWRDKKGRVGGGLGSLFRPCRLLQNQHRP